MTGYRLPGFDEPEFLHAPAPDYRTPRATYRLQLTPLFAFRDAAAIVPYLYALGVSHLYLSPIWESAGGGHGYDVIDHANVSSELGGLAGFQALAEVCRANEMRIILDIVPNHVGIKHARQPWWRDVLRYGPSSPFADYFDIAWEGQERSGGTVVCPVLDVPFGDALEAGEFRLQYDGHELVVGYRGDTFPLAPSSYEGILGSPPQPPDPGVADQLAEILARFREMDVVTSARLLSEFDVLFVSGGHHVRNWVESRLRALDGTAGQPHSFAALDAVLAAQHFRLAYWGVPSEEINYRRFFDINELAAIRSEHPPAFEATHELIVQLARDGLVDGLRVDHIDGLYDPSAYLANLQTAIRDRFDEGSAVEFPIWVEKILGRSESLAAAWPVAGTTGYDFLAKAGGLFIDPGAASSFDRIYEEFLGRPATYDYIAFASRQRIAERSFAREITVLALELHAFAQSAPREREITLVELREAIVGLLSCLPVYRTYSDVAEGDQMLVAAGREARQRSSRIAVEAMNFLVRVLLGSGEFSQAERLPWRDFRARFQQLSGPIMARGIEDTAFFRYHRLLATNEVGDTPGHFGVAPAEAHAWFAERAHTWPRSFNATTTHDTKRSEDARMRLAALSEVPRRWRNEVRSWARLNRRWLGTVDGQRVPDANIEYYLYQTLVAAWQGVPDEAFAGRMQSHLLKAMREGKTQTSWSDPNAQVEAGAFAFIEAILDGDRSLPFLTRLDAFVRVLFPSAAAKSLALLTLKCMAPGIPDFYQGSEFPLLSLTDPDNRRPVDFRTAIAAFDGLPERAPGPMSPDAKLWLTHRLLSLRAREPALFDRGSYRPLEVQGRSKPVFAFVRELDGRAVAVVVPRLASSSLDTEGRFLAGALDDASIDLPAPGPWRDWLGSEGGAYSGRVPLGAVMGDFPVAILVTA